MKTFAEVGINISSGRSGQIKMRCPQCDSKRTDKRDRSLSVNIPEGVWQCKYLPCSWSGTLKEKREWEPTTTKKVYRKSTYQTTTSDPQEKTLAWFATRGIPVEVVKRRHIEKRQAWIPALEREEWAIAFPFFRNGEIVNVKFRTADKQFAMEKGCEPIFYGLDDVTPECVVIVEGEIDALSCEVAGIKSVISVPNGAGTKLDDCLETAESILSPVRKFILAGDDDESGRRLMNALQLRLGPEKCWRVQWPAECKDANEVLVKYGATVLKDVLDAAKPVPIEGVFTISDLADSICDLYRDGIPQGVDPGWPSVREIYRPRLGETTFVTGVPGSGKSAFVSALNVNLAHLHGWQFCVFSPENMPLQQYASQLMELWAGEPFTEGPTKRMTQRRVLEAIEWTDKHFVLLNPPDEKRTVDGLLELAQQQIYRRGINGVVIDPWNEIGERQSANETETQYIGRSLMKIRQFARTWQIHVWVVAHPAKMQKSRDGSVPVPTLYDINGSSHWFNKADNGIVVHRDKENPAGPAEVRVQKVRFRYSGQIGQADLYFDRVTGRYSEKPFITEVYRGRDERYERES